MITALPVAIFVIFLTFIAENLMSREIIKASGYMNDKIASKITSILEALILILMIILYTLAIYNGIPIGDSSMW
jgi:hypothetical protein